MAARARSVGTGQAATSAFITTNTHERRSHLSCLVLSVSERETEAHFIFASLTFMLLSSVEPVRAVVVRSLCFRMRRATQLQPLLAALLVVFAREQHCKRDYSMPLTQDGLRGTLSILDLRVAAPGATAKHGRHKHAVLHTQYMCGCVRR